MDYVGMVMDLSETEKREFLDDLIEMAKELGVNLVGVSNMSTIDAIFFISGVLGFMLNV